MKMKWVCGTRSLLAIMMAFVILLFSGANDRLYCEGLELGRFRVSPKLSVIERYSDNIYLEADNEEDDWYTEITPEIAFDFAFAPRNYLSLKYIGNFFKYSDADNFDSQHHLGELSWNVESAKGSTLVVGASSSENSIQPYSPTESSKDYNLSRAFADVLLMAGQVTAVGVAYEHQSRRFDEDVFDIDDYDRDQFDASIIYGRSQILPWLLQYRYVKQDNENILSDDDIINRDFETHSIFTGARWLPSGKVSGAFRVGYTWSDFKESGIDEFSGFGMDTNVRYMFSPITNITLIARREIRPTTFTERDTGTYYVLTSGGVRLTHHRWERIETELRYYYNHRDFEGGAFGEEDRTDREHVAGLTVTYTMRNWIALSLGYQYRNNNSDDEGVDFKENLVHAGVLLSI